MARTGPPFNRSDCPYGCGAPLPSHPRLGPTSGPATACPGCGRWLYPMRALFSEGQVQLWPPPHVPRASEAATNLDLFFVVAKEDYIRRQDIEIELDRAARASDQSWWRYQLFGLLELLTFLAVILLARPLQWARDRLRGHEPRRRG